MIREMGEGRTFPFVVAHRSRFELFERFDGFDGFETVRLGVESWGSH